VLLFRQAPDAQVNTNPNKKEMKISHETNFSPLSSFPKRNPNPNKKTWQKV
jgi:hypothetical protein